MFTGIITDLGYLIAKHPQTGGVRMVFRTQSLDLNALLIGESIAVNGCCLTLIAREKQEFTVDVSDETLRCTNLALLQIDECVNLEPALKAHQSLGGHFVSGHVDGLGIIFSCDITDGLSTRLEVTLPQELLPLVAVKGSVCLNGVSLTVNTIHDNRIAINLIPHTCQHTNFQFLRPGAKVNVEVDLIARYVERLLIFKETL